MLPSTTEMSRPVAISAIGIAASVPDGAHLPPKSRFPETPLSTRKQLSRRSEKFVTWGMSPETAPVCGGTKAVVTCSAGQAIPWNRQTPARSLPATVCDSECHELESAPDWSDFDQFQRPSRLPVVAARATATGVEVTRRSHCDARPRSRTCIEILAVGVRNRGRWRARQRWRLSSPRPIPRRLNSRS